MQNSDVLNAREAANFLGCSYTQALAMAHEGKLPHYRLDKLMRFRRADLEQYIEKQIAASTKQQQETPV